LGDTNGQFDPEEGLVLSVSLSEGLGCTTEPSEAQESKRGVLPVRLVRTWVQIQACFRRQKGSLINAQSVRHPSWGETMSLRFREWCGSTVLCESV
jgi:hypothetical protein